jgi:hypothetical protein
MMMSDRMSWRDIEQELVDFFQKEGFGVWSMGGDQYAGLSWEDEFGEASIKTVSLTRLARRLAEKELSLMECRI